MNAFTSRPTGSRGCQISACMQTKACPNKATSKYWTGRVIVALCDKHSERYGAKIGALIVDDEGERITP